MTQSLAHPGAAEALAAAKARHPAGRLRGARSGPPLRFAEAVALLTGSWRVSDPTGFAAAMTTAPTLAGHGVTDLAAPAADGLVAALARAARRPKLALWWVSGRAAGHLHVEARAEVAAGRESPELFVVAHLVEALGPTGGRPAPADHSWVVAVVGDGRGGVAHVARATYCPRRPRCCPPAVAAARFPLAALRARLITPALEAEEASSPPPAVVLPLARRG